MLPLAWGPLQFEGRMSKDGFQITTISTWLNQRDIKPVVTGEIQAAAGGARVSMSIQPDPYANWTPPILLVLGLVLIFAGLVSGAWKLLFGVLIAAVLFVNMKLSFKSTANEAREKLRRLWSSGKTGGRVARALGS